LQCNNPQPPCRFSDAPVFFEDRLCCLEARLLTLLLAKANKSA